MGNTRRHHLNQSRQQQVRRSQIFDWQKHDSIDQSTSKPLTESVQNPTRKNTQEHS